MSRRFDLLVFSHVVPGDRPFGAQGYFFRELADLAEKRGITLGVADPLSGSAVDEMLVYNVNGVTVGRDFSAGAYYDRLAVGWQSLGLDSIRSALEVDKKVFNPLRAIELMSDKAATYECLTEAGLASPRTISVPRVLADRTELDGFPSALVLKPRKGSGGSGVRFVRRVGRDLAYRDSLITTSALRDDFADYLLQEDVGHEEILEVRTLVQRTSLGLAVIGSYAKVAQRGALGNISLGAQARSIAEVPEFPHSIPVGLLEGNALAACTEIERRQGGQIFEAGVDQAITKDGSCWILEVNGRPARFGFELVARHAVSATERANYAVIRTNSIQNVLDYSIDRR